MRTSRLEPSTPVTRCWADVIDIEGGRRVCCDADSTSPSGLCENCLEVLRRGIGELRLALRS